MMIFGIFPIFTRQNIGFFLILSYKQRQLYQTQKVDLVILRIGNFSKIVKFAVLSISLLTVMAGAAIAPALGIIKDHFCEASALSLQLIISIPALFIILTNLIFPWLSFCHS